MSAAHIRAVAICVFRHQGRILVNEAHDASKPQTFYRPLGGDIDFGETGAHFDAVWKALETFSHETPLYPHGLLELLRAQPH